MQTFKQTSRKMQTRRIYTPEETPCTMLSYASRRGEPEETSFVFHHMTKRDILAAFAQTNGSLTPDELRIRLRWSLDRRSVYSYLLRLARQGLLERERKGRGRLAYRLTERGLARLEFLNQKQS